MVDARDVYACRHDATRIERMASPCCDGANQGQVFCKSTRGARFFSARVVSPRGFPALFERKHTCVRNFVLPRKLPGLKFERSVFPVAQHKEKQVTHHKQQHASSTQKAKML